MTAYVVRDTRSGEHVATYRHEHVARQHANELSIRHGRSTEVKETR